MKADIYSDTSGVATESAIPDDLLEAAEAARERLVERVAESADSLIEKYLEGEELTLEEIRGRSRQGP